MTKHDPAEIEAVAGSIRASVHLNWNMHDWKNMALAAVESLDAHRAPAIRAAVAALIADSNALGVALARRQSEPYIEKLRKHRAESERALLAICGIDEQENA